MKTAIYHYTTVNLAGQTETTVLNLTRIAAISMLAAPSTGTFRVHMIGLNEPLTLRWQSTPYTHLIGAWETACPLHPDERL